jgi:hypothetical protein
MNLEDELRSALQREDPPQSFAGRVVAQAKSPARPVTSIFQAFRMPKIMWAGGIAAILAVGFAVTAEYREVKAERAGRDALMALRIASEKLNMTREQVLKQGDN